MSLGKAAEGVSDTHTLNDVFVRYAEEVSPTKRGGEKEKIRLTALGQFPIASERLIDLRRETFEDWISFRLKTVKPSSVNRDLNLISNCLTYARRWRLMKDNPLKDLKRPTDPPPRDRRILDKEIEEILVALNYVESEPVEQKQQKVAVIFLLAIETAMRSGEICGLKPDQVDLVKRVARLPLTKNGAARSVPLSTRAVELFRKVEPWPEEGTIFGITDKQRDALFRKYLKKTTIEDLVFHDSRHEATTRLAKKLEILDLARVTGHKNLKELMTYYNASAEEIATQLD
ncbi:tyrosine-type recombinase/integrase [Marinobacterium litorale]|uniref:tyrosine-type recombinase/integrase n=1 Tax=Marinobacterium litorale TaxID=404770 RepID=UPI0003FECACD|nr:site-specific integrase [Marinobacterium litorale]